MRLDRALSVYLARTIAPSRSSEFGRRVPVLMYHSISAEMVARHPYYEINTSPKVFAEHMSFLKERGYSTISLGGAVRALKSHTLSANSVVLTFDDGYRDFYTAAWPILQQYKMAATVFIVTEIATTGSCFNGKHCLSWTEVKELHESGISIGSHTETHPEVRFMKPAQIDDEIGRSKQTIEQRIGAAVRSFSYPYAFPETNRSLKSFLSHTLEKYGYENGVSTILGTVRPTSDHFFLPRIPVNTWDDLAFFQAKLSGAYDWLRFPQRLSKAAKERRVFRRRWRVLRAEAAP